MLFEIFMIGTFWFWALIALEFCVLIWALGREQYSFGTATVIVTLALLFFCGDIKIIGNWIWHNPLHTFGWALAYLGVGTVYAICKWWLFVRDVRDENRDAKKEWLANWKENLMVCKDELLTIKSKVERFLAASEIEQRSLNVRIRTGINCEYLTPNVEEDKIKIDSRLAELASNMSVLENSNGVMTADVMPLWKKYESTFKFQDRFNRSVGIVKPMPEEFKARIVSWIGYWPPSLFWTLLNDPLRRLGREIYHAISKLLRGISDSAWKDEDKLD